jgi:Raf kinase inhibitor-like YbhB/YbcL family protein
MTMTLTSSAFGSGDHIPARYTCDGDGVSPPLAWDGVPPEVQSFALVIDDPDAPDPAAPQTTWVHWVLYDVPAEARGLREGVGTEPSPAGGRQGQNDWKQPGYRGPCPPIGTHRYVHKLYALDTALGDLGTPTKHDLERAMEGHVLARAELVGLYARDGG